MRRLLSAAVVVLCVVPAFATDYWFSAILTPAAMGPAPHGLAATGSPIMNGLWTYLGMPTVSLPLLQVNGLPVGVQLVGLRHDDARLLRTARWLVGEVGG